MIHICKEMYTDTQNRRFVKKIVLVAIRCDSSNKIMQFQLDNY